MMSGNCRALVDMMDLPQDIWLTVLSLLDTKTVLTCMLVSKQMKQIVDQHTSLALDYDIRDTVVKESVENWKSLAAHILQRRSTLQSMSMSLTRSWMVQEKFKGLSRSADVCSCALNHALTDALNQVTQLDCKL